MAWTDHRPVKQPNLQCYYGHNFFYGSDSIYPVGLYKNCIMPCSQPDADCVRLSLPEKLWIQAHLRHSSHSHPQPGTQAPEAGDAPQPAYSAGGGGSTHFQTQSQQTLLWQAIRRLVSSAHWTASQGSQKQTAATSVPETNVHTPLAVNFFGGFSPLPASHTEIILSLTLCDYP